MEFGWSEEEQAFRQEVRTYLQSLLPPNWDEMNLNEEEEHPYAVGFAKKLAEKKWRVLHWPERYGGLGYGHWRQLIYNEEVEYLGLPGASDSGTSFVGPSIMMYGTEAQKDKYLNAIARAEISFCQLFTEPGAGSDLASLQTAAVADGDDWVINGQKIFTSGAHNADYGWLGARTDPDAPKHRGISTFAIDMKTPGITIRPLVNMTGAHVQNQVFLDDVRVPRDALVGEENRGWYQMATTLDFERSGIGRFAAAKRLLGDLAAYARETRRDGEALAKDGVVRSKLAELAIEVEVGRFIGYRTAWMQSKGLVPNREASAARLFGGLLNQRMANVGVNLMGLYGQLRRGSKYAPLFGRVEHLYKETVFYTIGAGTQEIQRNIIAGRGLGLPR